MFSSNLNPVRMNPRLGYVVGNSETNVALADWSWHVPCAYQCALFAARLESQFVIPGRVAHPNDIWIFPGLRSVCRHFRHYYLLNTVPQAGRRAAGEALAYINFRLLRWPPRKRWPCLFFNPGRTTETESLRIVEARILAVGGMSRLATAEVAGWNRFPIAAYGPTTR
jgi:hypothetical protein